MTLSLPSARARPAAAAVVLGLHALLGLALLQLGAWKDRGPPPSVQAPLMLWLLDRQPPPAAPRALPQATPPPPLTRRSATPSPRPAPVPAEPQAITLPTEPAAAPAPAPEAPPDTTATGPAPLNLALPRAASAPWRTRNPALDDPRANSARATLESRIASALGGSDRITEERLDDGRMRLRRGNACVVVHPSRAERLDPWNASVLPKMRGVEPC